MADADYYVPERRILQIMPAVGMRAVYRYSDGSYSTNPIVALALCNVRVDCYNNGRLKRRGTTSRQVCALESVEGEGIVFCDCDEFVGVLAPGQTIEELPK